MSAAGRYAVDEDKAQTTAAEREQLLQHLTHESCHIFKHTPALNKAALTHILQVAGNLERTIQLIETLNHAHIQYGSVIELCIGLQSELDDPRFGSSPLPPTVSRVESRPARSAAATAERKTELALAIERQQEQARNKTVVVQRPLEEVANTPPFGYIEDAAPPSPIGPRADLMSGLMSIPSDPSVAPGHSSADRDALFEYLSNDSCLIFRHPVSLGKSALNHILKVAINVERAIQIIEALNNAHMQFDGVVDLCLGMQSEMDHTRFGSVPLAAPIGASATRPPIAPRKTALTTAIEQMSIASSYAPIAARPSTSSHTPTRASPRIDADTKQSSVQPSSNNSWITPRDRDTLFAYLEKEECLVFRVEIAITDAQLDELLLAGESAQGAIDLIRSLNAMHFQFDSVRELSQRMSKHDLSSCSPPASSSVDRDALFEYLASDTCLIFHQPVSLRKGDLHRILQVTKNVERTIEVIETLNHAQHQYASVDELCRGMQAELAHPRSGMSSRSGAGRPPAHTRPSLLAHALDQMGFASRESGPLPPRPSTSQTPTRAPSRGGMIGSSLTHNHSFVTPHDRDVLFAYLATEECLVFRVEIAITDEQLDQMIMVSGQSVDEAIQRIETINSTNRQYDSVEQLVVAMSSLIRRRVSRVSTPVSPMIHPSIVSPPPSSLLQPIPSERIREEGRIHPLLETPFYIGLCLRFSSLATLLHAVRVSHSWRSGVREALELIEDSNGFCIQLQNRCQKDQFIRVLSNQTILPFRESRQGYVDSSRINNVDESSHRPSSSTASMWHRLRALDLEYNLDEIQIASSSSSSSSNPTSSSRFVSTLHTLLCHLPKVRFLRLGLTPSPTDPSNGNGQPHRLGMDQQQQPPYTQRYTMRDVFQTTTTSIHSSPLNQLSHSLTHLYCLEGDEDVYPRFNTIDATRIFHTLTTKLTNLIEFEFRWRMVNQYGSKMSDEIGFIRPSEFSSHTIEAGQFVHLDSLLHLERLERLTLAHVEFTTRAGEVLHLMSTRYGLRKVYWSQRSYLTDHSSTYDPNEEIKSYNFTNDLGGINALLAQPPSKLTRFEWIQPDGMFTPTDLRAMFALPSLTELRVAVKHIDLPSAILAVISTTQRAARLSTSTALLRSFDISCIVSFEVDALHVASWVDQANHAATAWSAALARMPTLTQLTLRDTVILSVVLRNLGVGLNQLKHLILRRSRFERGFVESVTQQLWYRLERMEIIEDHTDTTIDLASLIGESFLNLPNLKSLTVVRTKAFRFDDKFASTMIQSTSKLEEFIYEPFNEDGSCPDASRTRARCIDSSMFDSSIRPAPEIDSRRHPTRCCRKCQHEYQTLSEMMKQRMIRTKKRMSVTYKGVKVEVV